MFSYHHRNCEISPPPSNFTPFSDSPIFRISLSTHPSSQPLAKLRASLKSSMILALFWAITHVIIFSLRSTHGSSCRSDWPYPRSYITEFAASVAQGYSGICHSLGSDNLVSLIKTIKTRGAIIRRWHGYSEIEISSVHGWYGGPGEFWTGVAIWGLFTITAPFTRVRKE